MIFYEYTDDLRATKAELTYIEGYFNYYIVHKMEKDIVENYNMQINYSILTGMNPYRNFGSLYFCTESFLSLI